MTAKTIGREAVIILAILIVALLVLAAYFSNRGGYIDEIGLFNPSYMDLHYGKITYPIHGYFDNMVVHPPVHYKLIAAFMRLGFTYYYGQATPAFLMLLVAIALILAGPFPPPVKIGLMFGLVAPILFTRALEIELFGMRPENHLNAAWIAGLVALESARLENWNWRKLALGAFLLTYASGLHYYAMGAFLGAGVYAIWALLQFGWRAARKPLLAIALGGLLFGIPYLLLFIIPDRSDIWGQLRLVPRESVAVVLDDHLAHYREWSLQRLDGPWLKVPFARGIPLVLLSTPILLALRTTRGIALAALPLQLFVLLFAGHSHAYYYIHEISMYAAALAAGILTTVDRLLMTVPRQELIRRIVLASLAIALGSSILVAKWSLGQTSLHPFPRVHEAEIARVAGKEMLGPDARVGGRIGAWYASGAAHWFNISPDLLWRPLPMDFDVTGYLSKFDALAENWHMSGATSNHRNTTLSSWWAAGILHLRGVFFSEHNSDLSYVLLRVAPQPSITGFALKQDQLYRFQEGANGNQELASLVCLLGDAVTDFRKQAPFSVALDLPQSSPNEQKRIVLTMIIPSNEPSYSAPLQSQCREIQSVRGDLTLAGDTHELVAKMRSNDKPMRFYRQISDFSGTGK